MIQEHIKKPLADEILFGSLAEGRRRQDRRRQERPRETVVQVHRRSEADGEGKDRGRTGGVISNVRRVRSANQERAARRAALFCLCCVARNADSGQAMKLQGAMLFVADIGPHGGFLYRRDWAFAPLMARRPRTGSSLTPANAVSRLSPDPQRSISPKIASLRAATRSCRSRLRFRRGGCRRRSALASKRSASRSWFGRGASIRPRRSRRQCDRPVAPARWRIARLRRRRCAAWGQRLRLLGRPDGREGRAFQFGTRAILPVHFLQREVWPSH